MQAAFFDHRPPLSTTNIIQPTINMLDNMSFVPFIVLGVLIVFCTICAVCSDKSDRSVAEKIIDHIGSEESKKAGLRVLKKLLYYYLLIGFVCIIGTIIYCFIISTMQ